MKWIVITLPIVVVATGIILASRFVSYASSLPEAPIKKINNYELWNIIQSWRKESGYKEYIKNDSLCRIALDRLDDGDYSDHRYLLEKYSKYPSVISENKTGAVDSNHALISWLNSEPHRKALERDYIYSCVASSEHYAVQIFSNCENGCP